MEEWRVLPEFGFIVENQIDILEHKVQYFKLEPNG